jgi:hypothetical protein
VTADISLVGRNGTNKKRMAGPVASSVWAPFLLPAEPVDFGRIEDERRCTVNAIKATWINGQILPAEPVDWPEGSELLVEPVAALEKIGLDEAEWLDDAQSIADWVAWVDTIEPLLLSDEERAEMERYRAEQRRFNIEAVRQQMQLGDAS